MAILLGHRHGLRWARATCAGQSVGGVAHCVIEGAVESRPSLVRFHRETASKLRRT
ncbi:hypothetical protein BC567DRAFT_239516 [Phyllosticta citribraziliensis]